MITIIIVTLYSIFFFKQKKKEMLFLKINFIMIIDVKTKIFIADSLSWRKRK